MISALVFSRDRPAQLDLLLRSIKKNMPKKFFSHIDVLFYCSDRSYRRAYNQLKVEHKGFAHCWGHIDFALQTVERLIQGKSAICLLCDDDIIYRKFNGRPDDFLKDNPDVLAVSLRLGMNTKICYPLRREQQRPQFKRRGDVATWKWEEADGDFSYPGSLDGHVFRKGDLLKLIDGDFHNPNTLEDVLVRNCRGRQELMACYEKSSVVGNPVNRVNETHIGNRFGEEFYATTDDLLERYVAGERLNPKIPPSKIRGAHQEIELGGGA